MAPNIIRTWVRVRGTDKVYQLTKGMAEADPPRVNQDLLIITEKEARFLQAKSVTDKKQRAVDKRQGATSKALEEAKQRQVEAEADLRKEEAYQQALAAQQEAGGDGTPETPEQVEARLAAEEAAAAGGESGAIKEDDLDEKNRKELMAIIDGEELEIKKQGTNKALVVAIRETRKLVAKAEADAQTE